MTLYLIGIVFILLSGVASICTLTAPTGALTYLGLGTTFVYFCFGLTTLTEHYKLEAEKFRKEWLNCASPEDQQKIKIKLSI